MFPSYQTVPLANVPTKANVPKDERSSTPVMMMKKVAIVAMVGTALVAGYTYGASTSSTTNDAAGVSFTTFPPYVPDIESDYCYCRRENDCDRYPSVSPNGIMCNVYCRYWYEAQTCGEVSTDEPTDPAMIDIATTTTGAAGVSFTTFPPTVPPATIPSTSVLCAGQIESNYCDCGGDCTANPSFCACDEAQTKTCCAIPSDTVLCPGQREDDYCDCKSDCKKFPSVCACDEAQTQTCCGL